MFAVKLRDMRRAQGLTQTDLAEELGVSDGAVSHWEVGRERPSKKNLIKTADFFGVSAAWMAEDDPEMKKKLKELIRMGGDGDDEWLRVMIDEAAVRSLGAFPGRLRELREKAGVSIVELERVSGVSRNSLSNYERGLHVPGGEALVRLAVYYGVSVDDIMGSDGGAE